MGRAERAVQAHPGPGHAEAFVRSGAARTSAIIRQSGRRTLPSRYTRLCVQDPYRSAPFRDLLPGLGRIDFDDHSLIGVIREMIANGRIEIPGPETERRDLKTGIAHYEEAAYLLDDCLLRRAEGRCELCLDRSKSLAVVLAKGRRIVACVRCSGRLAP